MFPALFVASAVGHSNNVLIPPVTVCPADISDNELTGPTDPGGPVVPVLPVIPVGPVPWGPVIPVVPVVPVEPLGPV